jgi:Raf kinase inhibitor-like YbhB/YbcL family protein
MSGEATSEKIKTLVVSSDDFENGGLIPSRFTCDAVNVNPSLRISLLPKETESLVLIVDDPDAPSKTWIHWIVWNIRPTTLIRENSIPGIQGMNDFRRMNYGGPCPPSGTHRYFFKIFALDKTLDLRPGASIFELEKAMHNHILAGGEIFGTYERRKK